MISVSGCSLSARRAVSLTGASACGSHLSRPSRRTRKASAKEPNKKTSSLMSFYSSNDYTSA
ncbi:hypothetical protein [Fictibacillus sp. FJAT-27399]|uniref:hypothetical protein n=1 Tax=Fictibacillus sp. FJAT-27399 TaxID=1729689 RepID=UPI0012E3A16A|nr:hypothetical protein [Fictibacillus sp. FJAT-27399]